MARLTQEGTPYVRTAAAMELFERERRNNDGRAYLLLMRPIFMGKV